MRQAADGFALDEHTPTSACACPIARAYARSGNTSCLVRTARAGRRASSNIPTLGFDSFLIRVHPFDDTVEFGRDSFRASGRRPARSTRRRARRVTPVLANPTSGDYP